jgi:thiamine phosphate synthase YjbQ (UPF0047 family)
MSGLFTRIASTPKVSGAGSSVTDITQQVKDFLNVQHSSGEQLSVSGIASVTSQHTTTAVTVNEFEIRLVEDLRLWLNKKAPGGEMYLHNDLEVREVPGGVQQESPSDTHGTRPQACLMLRS